MKLPALDSLPVRLTACLSGGLFVIVAFHLALIGSEQRLTDATRMDAHRIAGFLQAFVVHELHEGHHDLSRDLNILAEIPELVSVELLGRGAARVVALPHLGDGAVPCGLCAPGVEAGPGRPDYALSRVESRGTVMTVRVPLNNDVHCHGCHRADGPEIASLHIGVSIEDEAARQRRARRMIIGAGSGMLLVSLAAIALLSDRLVGRPLRRLVRPMVRLRGGDFAARAEVAGARELRFVAESFNGMAETIQKLDAERQDVIHRQSGEIEESRAQIAHQERMASLGLMAAGIAHEIGNPLAAVSSVAQLLRHRSPDGYTREQVDLILVHVDRVQSILRELSDFSRPQAQEKVLTDPNEVLEAAARIGRFDRRGRSVRMERELSSGLARVELVPDHLLQVLINLILNAFDAMPDGGTLTLRSARDGADLILEVEDTGTGIEPAILPRIFDPFFSTKPPGSGTGLGLSVSWGIMANLGGRIEVKSEPGRGSRFRVVLPASREASPSGRLG